MADRHLYRFPRWPCALIAFLALAVGGCGKPTYPVKGQVVYADDGKPVPAGVTIWFESTEPPYDRASGLVGEEGRFILSTVRENSGAMKGEHRIRFDPPFPVMTASAEVALSKVMHPRYYEYATSGLKETIVPGENTFTIKVEKAR